MLRIDEKNIREYSIPNVCGVIITTNHKTDGIYLPADDRRHFVAWSDLDKERLRRRTTGTQLLSLVRPRRLEIVGYHLAEHDLADFNPKAPPPQTDAFWEIVDAYAPPKAPN